MLYKIHIDNTKEINLNTDLLNCSMEIAILNRAFKVGAIKERTYNSTKTSILKQYNLSHVGI